MFQFRKTLLNDVPDFPVVNQIVTMNQHIPERYHSLKIPQFPGDGGIVSGYALMASPMISKWRSTAARIIASSR
jgi:hypothetical protein